MGRIRTGSVWADASMKILAAGTGTLAGEAERITLPIPITAVSLNTARAPSDRTGSIGAAGVSTITAGAGDSTGAALGFLPLPLPLPGRSGFSSDGRGLFS